MSDLWAAEGQFEECGDDFSAFDLRSDCVGEAVQSASYPVTDNSHDPHVFEPALLDPILPDLDQHGIHLSPVELMSAVCTSFLTSRTALGQFTRSCLECSGACTMQSGIPSSSIWPVPPPRWRWSACKRPGIRRRTRRKFLEVRHRLLQLLVCTLNWEALGCPKHAPAECKLGAPISVQQHLVLERLEIKLNHFLKCPPFAADDLGRAKEKFGVVISLVKELPQCSLGLQDLAVLFQSIHNSMNPYSQQFADSTDIQTHSSHGRNCNRDSVSCEDFEPLKGLIGSSDFPAHQCSFADQRIPFTSKGSKEVIADRIKWKNPASFDPSPYLENPLVRAAFKGPEVLRKPPDLWPRSVPGKVFCARDELLKLAEKWDRLGTCRIFDASTVDWHEAVGLFAVPKDNEYDRLIINPKAINSRMFTISESTKTLAPGCMLGLLHLEPNQVFRISADDMTDFYYTFRVSDARARRNCIRVKFEPHELRHLQSFKPEHESCQELVVSLGALAMGDSLAVEIAQAAHAGVLKQWCGSMNPDEVLRYRFPVPRGSFIELLAIDDHVGIQRLLREEYLANKTCRDSHVFALAEEAYKQVGLVQHEQKRKRNLLQATILGCDFDGDQGIASAPRDRLSVLALLTMAVVIQGTCTPKLLSIILGCWVHALLYRRILFSVLDAVFREGQGLSADQVFCLSSRSRNELQTLSVLAPMAHSDLRVTYAPDIYTTDASPWGGAVCKAFVGQSVTRELWRHSEQKGYYTRLENPIAALLTEKGLEHVSDQFGFETPQDPIASKFSPQRWLSEGFLFDCIELFRGTGNWSTAHQQQGLIVHDGIDTDGRRIRCKDLSDPSVCHEVAALAARGVIREWHAGLPCVSFGTLRRPRVRSKQFPFGFDPLDAFTKYHNSLAQKTGLILMLAFQMGCFISVEQPGGSTLFHLHIYQTLIRLGCIITRFCFCSYGSALMKPSKWLHNKPWVESLASKCTCEYRGRHFVAQGVFTKDNIQEFDSRCRPSCQVVYGRMPRIGESVAAFSGAYPRGLMQRMASGAAAAKHGSIGSISLSSRIRSFKEIGMDPSFLQSVSSVFAEPFPKRKWHEDPEWISELCNSLPFKECFRYKFSRSGHINVNEGRTYKSWIKMMAKERPDSRFLGILDSRVTIGAAAKGRSSSDSLSRIFRGSLPYILGANLYPGCVHCSSQDNRADEPSRDRPVRGPSRHQPLWLTELQHDRTRHFDVVLAGSQATRVVGRWIRLLLLIAGDVEQNPGPRGGQPLRQPRGQPLRQPRGPMDLTTGFVAATAQRMEKCYDAFIYWLSHEFPRSFRQLMSSGETAAFALRAYGLHCFQSGLPRYLFVYAITATQDRYAHYRQYMSPAWQIDRKWQLHEPGECRAVLPPSAIRSALCVACLWHWYQWLGATLLGFSAMLHPSEILALTRRDLVLPRDTAFDSQHLYIHVRDPKTARFARRQHGRVDDPFVIAIIDKLFGNLKLSDRLFMGSISGFRSQWNHVMRFLGIPCSAKERGATPAVLRGSGATFLYQSSEDVQWVAWRGRWSRYKTLEYYLQEVSAQLLIHELSDQARARLLFFDRCAFGVLCSRLDLRCSIAEVEV